MNLARIGLALLIGCGSALFLRFGRAFPWTLAAIVGVAAALLVGVTFQTGDRIRRMRR